MLFVIFFVILATVNAVQVNKHSGIEGGVKLIETDSKGISYVVTNFNETTYVLDQENDVIFSASLNSVVRIMLNNLEEAYVFDYISATNTMNVHMFDFVSLTLKPVISYEPGSSWPFFFDGDGNLFYNSVDGIGILRKNETYPVVISDLEGFQIISKETYAVDKDGSVYIGLNNDTTTRVVMFTKNEIYKPDPSFDTINVDINQFLSFMASYNDSIYFGGTRNFVRFKDGVQYDLYRSDNAYVDFVEFTVVNDRFYFQTFYVISGLALCNFSYVAPGDQWENIQVVLLSDSFDTFSQAFDKDGTLFLGYSNTKLLPSYVCVSDPDENECKAMNVPNNLTIEGLEATGNGDLFISAQDLYFVERGTMDAVRVSEFPRNSRSWPMKAKQGMDEVLIGSDDGLYIASV